MILLIHILQLPQRFQLLERIAIAGNRSELALFDSLVDIKLLLEEACLDSTLDLVDAQF
jgi:hypothetical protein